MVSGGSMKQLKYFCIVGVIFTSIAGTISHFVYEWSGNNFLVGLFFPVNESTWEHMKLIFFPMLVFALLGGKWMEKQIPCIYDAMFGGILTGLAAILVFFYTYSGILGYNVDWLNITLYYISVLAAYAVVYKLAETCKGRNGKLLRYSMYLLIVAFLFFTVYPPKIGLFVSP